MNPLMLHPLKLRCSFRLIGLSLSLSAPISLSLSPSLSLSLPISLPPSPSLNRCQPTSSAPSPAALPRPARRYNVFISDRFLELKASNPTLKAPQIMTKAAAEWKVLDENVRDSYKKKAAAANE